VFVCVFAWVWGEDRPQNLKQHLRKSLIIRAMAKRYSLFWDVSTVKSQIICLVVCDVSAKHKNTSLFTLFIRFQGSGTHSFHNFFQQCFVLKRKTNFYIYNNRFLSTHKYKFFPIVQLTCSFGAIQGHVFSWHHLCRDRWNFMELRKRLLWIVILRLQHGRYYRRAELIINSRYGA